jgi:iron-sulfur cluster assembly protein
MALPPPINITDGAAERIRTLLEKRGTPSAGVKVGVRSGGCSGLSYVIEYADEIEKFDEVVSYPDAASEEFKVIIDPKAVMYLIGSEMDYVEEKMKSGFTFQNPNEKGRCGCGESFHV